MHTTTQPAPVEHGNGQPIFAAPASAAAPPIETMAETPLWQRVVAGIVVLSVLTAFCAYVLGLQLPGLYGRSSEGGKENNKEKSSPPAPAVSLVKDKPHTVEVPENVRRALGILKDNRELLAAARRPDTMPPVVMTGSTALDPQHLARIRARFAPARVVEIAQVHDFSPKTGRSMFRELDMGDHVQKGDILGVFYSVDVGSKKNDLLDALVQLELDQKVLDAAEKHREAVPEVFMHTQMRAVQGDRIAINRALNNLRVWDIPQEDIDELHEEAKKIAADKNAWFKTPEGRWVKGEKQAKNGNGEPGQKDKDQDRWARVTLRAPFHGVIVERNLHLGEMIVDQTVNLFQIADVSRMLVIANAPEDQLPVLRALDWGERRWTIRTVGVTTADDLPGPIERIGWLIDPNQHTAVIEGYVDNSREILRGGQTVSATVRIPPPTGVVEIPVDALVDDGKQALVFVQTDANKNQRLFHKV
jgi:cobalt-zinc-cadmium efflux system membrane fusion protein